MGEMEAPISAAHHAKLYLPFGLVSSCLQQTPLQSVTAIAQCNRCFMTDKTDSPPWDLNQDLNWDLNKDAAIDGEQVKRWIPPRSSPFRRQ